MVVADNPVRAITCFLESIGIKQSPEANAIIRKSLDSGTILIKRENTAFIARINWNKLNLPKGVRLLFRQCWQDFTERVRRSLFD
jgi:hypothetical protein|tara:strand:- start:1793 stop:2047 length:255 start_codon:yes stop_codon:yes gene_type:complete